MELSRDKRSRRRRRWFAAVTAIAAIVTTLLATEVVVRFGYLGPTSATPPSIKVERVYAKGVNVPASDESDTDPQLTRPDDLLGYTHLPGRFHVTLRDGFTFTMTHRQDTLRITRPLESYDSDDHRPALWIFGCSFTHGWSVNDEETFPWRVQEMLPDVDVVNFGVSGYDQLHALLQFGQALASRPAPQAIVVTYAHFHDERNTFSRSYRRGTLAQMSPRMRSVMQFPYANLGAGFSVVIRRRSAKASLLTPLSSLMLANYVDGLFDHLDDRLTRSHDVSKALILQFGRRCHEEGIKLVVAGITDEPETWDVLAFCLRNEMNEVDISFDFSNSDYMNAPHDPEHPSPAGQHIYAERLVAYLRESGVLSAITNAVDDPKKLQSDSPTLHDDVPSSAESSR